MCSPLSRLVLSTKCVQAFLKLFHSLPCITGRVADTARAQRVCTLCQTGNLGDEQHLVFECLALQELRSKDRYCRCCTLAYMGIMPLHWFKSGGNMTLMQLRNSCKEFYAKNVWTHTVMLVL